MGAEEEDDKEGTAAAGGKQKPRNRADILFTLDASRPGTLSNSAFIDVVVTCPTAGMTAAQRGATRKNAAGHIIGGHGRPQGEAADEHAALKVKAYSKRFDITTTRFFPFALESTGFMHKTALDALRTIVKLQSAYWDSRAAAGVARYIPYGTRFRRAVERMSTALQEGNAHILTGYRLYAARKGVHV